MAAGEALAPRVRETPTAQSQASLFELYLADAYMGAKDYQKALETMDRCAAQAPDPRKATVTYCMLRRAQAYDLMGRRAEALGGYREVKERPDYFDSRDKARKGLKTPLTYAELLIQLQE